MKNQKQKKDALLEKLKAEALYNIVYSLIKMTYASGKLDTYDLVSMVSRSEKYLFQVAEAEKKLRSIATANEIEELSKSLKQGDANVETEKQREAAVYVLGESAPKVI